MGAEMDCCDSTDEGRRFYVELKTSREVDIHIHFIRFGMHLFLIKMLILLSLQISSKMSLFLQLDYHTEERFEREKLLKFWVHLLQMTMNLHKFPFHLIISIAFYACRNIELEVIDL